MVYEELKNGVLAWNSRMITDDMAGVLDVLGTFCEQLFDCNCGAYAGCYMAAKYPDKVKSLVTVGGGAWSREESADDFLPENLLEKNDTGFIEDMKMSHYEAHRGDWQAYLRTTVADWKAHPNLNSTSLFCEWTAGKN